MTDRMAGTHPLDSLVSSLDSSQVWGLSFLTCKWSASPGPPFTAPSLPSSRGGQDLTSLRVIAGLHARLRAQGAATQGLA